MIPNCLDQGVGCLPWSPLARGFLCGNRKLMDKELIAAADAKNKENKEKAAAVGSGSGGATPKSAAAAVTTELAPVSPTSYSHIAAGGDSKDSKTVATTRTASDPMALNYYYGDIDFKITERCMEIGKKRGGKPAAQIALAWILSKPGVTAPIIGATKISHLEDAVAALDIKLDENEIKYLEELYQPKKVLGNLS